VFFRQWFGIKLSYITLCIAPNHDKRQHLAKDARPLSTRQLWNSTPSGFTARPSRCSLSLGFK
jgi:hypothetical protein